jgi:hypothetical protein
MCTHGQTVLGDTHKRGRGMQWSSAMGRYALATLLLQNEERRAIEQ